MKKLKNHLPVLIIAMLTLSATSYARPADAETHQRIVNLSMKNFRYSLKSDIRGIVEGTILDVVVFKKFYPALDFDAIAERLNDVAQSSKVPVVSYKAHLASIYLAYAGQFEIVPNVDPEKQDDVFTQIADQLEKKLGAQSNAGNTMSSR